MFRPRSAISGPLLMIGLVVMLLSGQLVADGSLGPVFRMIGVADGLPDSRVEGVVQDAHGYVWIATQSGLVRHEGNELRVIGSDPDREDPLPGRNITSLYAHSDGTVWAAVSGEGVVQLGPDLRQRRHLKPDERGGVLPAGTVWNMVEDCNGDLWIALMQGGVGRYNPETDEFTLYPQDESSGLNPEGFQLALMRDSLCRIWLTQSEQLNVIDPANDERFRRVVGKQSGTMIYRVQEVDGEIYYSENSLLYGLGPVATAVEAAPTLIFQADRVITDVHAAPDSDAVFVSSYSGLYRIDLDTGEHEHMRAIPGLNDGLPGSTLLSLMIDLEGGTWIAIPRHGVAYLPPGQAAFERFHPVPGRDGGLDIDVVGSLAERSNPNELWLGSQHQGIRILDLQTGNFLPKETYFSDDDLPLKGNTITGFYLEEDRQLLATHEYVLLLDARQGSVRKLLSREQVHDGTFRSIRVDGDDVWVTTFDAGVFRLDTASGERRQFWPGGEGRYHLPEAGPVMFEQGADGSWWLAGARGVYRFTADRGFELTAEPVRPPVLAAAWHGDSLWAASETGIKRWTWKAGELAEPRHYDLSGRLPPGRVHDILAGDDDLVWLVRSNGLVRLEAETDRLRNFSRADGLAVSEFHQGASLRLSDGRLALGGARGLVLADPEKMGGFHSEPPVHLRSLSTGRREIELVPGGSREIVLKHDESSFFVDYGALSYLSFAQNRYRVRLSGWDEDWLEFVGQTRHHYSNLAPGTYRFEVRGASADGTWNEQGDHLEIRIQHPPWLSAWALAAYGILGLTGAAVGWRSFNNARRRRLEMREARQKRALAEEQRLVVERLNRTLDPLRLARTIGEEMLVITGGRVAWLGFEHDMLPRELVGTDEDAEPPSREQWRAELEQADGVQALALMLAAEGEQVARVLIQADERGFQSDFGEGLDLLRQMASQALHNALLLERVRALALRAEQASSAKSEFLATMSHEIRTPLHGVLGMVELLYETETEPGQQDILNTLRQSGLQLQRIIDDVLDISRIEAGRMSLTMQPFELVAMLEQVIDLHAPNAARKGLDLRLRIASDLPLMFDGDAGRISQVLGNLLSNAVKFTEAGNVELSASSSSSGELCLVVSDSGPGIQPEDRERLFEPFTQLDASITRSHSGSGLGLAICRRLVKAMNGRLELLPARHGGSRFAVFLPAAEQASMQGIPVSATRLLDDVSIASVVDAPTRRVLHRLCRRWGIDHLDADRAQPRPCTLLLVDARISVNQQDTVGRWQGHARHVAWLQSPYSRSSGEEMEMPSDANFLRWPLIESRLIGLMLDLALIDRQPQQ